MNQKRKPQNLDAAADEEVREEEEEEEEEFSFFCTNHRWLADFRRRCVPGRARSARYIRFSTEISSSRNAYDGDSSMQKEASSSSLRPPLKRFFLRRPRCSVVFRLGIGRARSRPRGNVLRMVKGGVAGAPKQQEQFHGVLEAVENQRLGSSEQQRRQGRLKRRRLRTRSITSETEPRWKWDKRRSYLPYRPGLVGFFTNVNGLSRNVHPF
ncbi:hypothetical protein M0R45_022596 [Rubus argutus]|uniref:Uncharacterized protein n=1 Tax=Rubus argutus TaxID=59490 RepID=A0AAW1XG16_RUBAR